MIPGRADHYPYRRTEASDPDGGQVASHCAWQTARFLEGAAALTDSGSFPGILLRSDYVFLGFQL
jgi:hypothetical protein